MNQPDYLDPDNFIVAEREIRTELILWDMPAEQPVVFFAEWIRGKRREWLLKEKSIWNRNRQLTGMLRAVKQSNERYRIEIMRRKEEIKSLKALLRKAGGGGGD